MLTIYLELMRGSASCSAAREHAKCPCKVAEDAALACSDSEAPHSSFRERDPNDTQSMDNMSSCTMCGFHFLVDKGWISFPASVWKRSATLSMSGSSKKSRGRCSLSSGNLMDNLLTVTELSTSLRIQPASCNAMLIFAEVWLAVLVYVRTWSSFLKERRIHKNTGVSIKLSNEKVQKLDSKDHICFTFSPLVLLFRRLLQCSRRPLILIWRSGCGIWRYQLNSCTKYRTNMYVIIASLLKQLASPKRGSVFWVHVRGKCTLHNFSKTSVCPWYLTKTCAWTSLFGVLRNLLDGVDYKQIQIRSDGLLLPTGERAVEFRQTYLPFTFPVLFHLPPTFLPVQTCLVSHLSWTMIWDRKSVV